MKLVGTYFCQKEKGRPPNTFINNNKKAYKKTKTLAHQAKIALPTAKPIHAPQKLAKRQTIFNKEKKTIKNKREQTPPFFRFLPYNY